MSKARKMVASRSSMRADAGRPRLTARLSSADSAIVPPTGSSGSPLPYRFSLYLSATHFFATDPPPLTALPACPRRATRHHDEAMRPRRLWLILIGVLVLVALIVAVLRRDPEPSYGGRSLSEWLARLAAGPDGDPP